MTVIELGFVLLLLAIGIACAFWGNNLLGLWASILFFFGGIGVSIIVLLATAKFAAYLHRKKLRNSEICKCGSRVGEEHEWIGATENGEPIAQCKCGRIYALRENGHYHEIQQENVTLKPGKGMWEK